MKKGILIALLLFVVNLYCGLFTRDTKVTPDGGFAVKLYNYGPSDIVKGTVVSFKTNDNSKMVIASSNGLLPIGVVYSDTIESNETGWIVISGTVDVLLVATTNIAITNSVIPGDYIMASVGSDYGKAYMVNTLPATTNILSNVIVEYSAKITNFITNYVSHDTTGYSNAYSDATVTITNFITNIYGDYTNGGTELTRTNVITNYFNYVYQTSVNVPYTNIAIITNITTNYFNYTYGAVLTNSTEYVASNTTRLLGYSVIHTNNSTNSVYCRILIKK